MGVLTVLLGLIGIDSPSRKEEIKICKQLCFEDQYCKQLCPVDISFLPLYNDEFKNCTKGCTYSLCTLECKHVLKKHKNYQIDAILEQLYFPCELIYLKHILSCRNSFYFDNECYKKYDKAKTKCINQLFKL